MTVGFLHLLGSTCRSSFFMCHFDQWLEHLDHSPRPAGLQAVQLSLSWLFCAQLLSFPQLFSRGFIKTIEDTTTWLKSWFYTDTGPQAWSHGPYPHLKYLWRHLTTTSSHPLRFNTKTNRRNKFLSRYERAP